MSAVRVPRVPKPVSHIEPWQHRRLRGYWKELSPSLTTESTEITESADPERAARMEYSSQKLGRTVGSWKDLTKTEAGKLIAAMRADLDRNKTPGSDVASPDALEIIARLALEVYGQSWFLALQERLKQSPYFHYTGIQRISPYQSHTLIEELFDYWERKLYPDEASMEIRGQRKEELRARFSPQRHRGAEKGKGGGRDDSAKR